MMLSVTVLAGLPPYGEMAIAYPETWAQTGREGVVVEFESETAKWVGNFRPGLGGLELAALHPNRRDAVVIAAGDLWVVNGETRSAEHLLPGIVTAVPVTGPDGWILNRQDLALARLGPDGIVWHTRRLSWDGFDDLRIDGTKLTGLSWSAVDDSWKPFEVDIKSGRSTGGSYSFTDDEKWELLA